ncbi:putative tartrate transporter [Sphingobium herbicidovorans NBRC 16415]|uniref:Tartrate transporter n=1 Tax=Sphingobium herbicidovorans (strain ATCC 700291 / DSM 11019 / CCUG 56400 / KCTC 2939 / LMG 18315 / NBRC 16415 / MH) TaxID=1219045 RepID=A0A086PBW3_SPHHM|nr:MFS transporter [Sphingobium herbicidovorans]KFG90881.1 putative tartrate transporter [Sphingobium herbicidovorans NBRC 16415]
MNNSDIASGSAMATSDFEAAAIKKAFRRLMPLMAGCFMAYLDRTNLSFAALSMNADLGLTMTMFGVATSVFFVTYVMFEIPSNVMLEKFGARIWIPRIMITWGLASMAMVFISGP